MSVSPAQRKAAARDAGRRREALNVLRLAESTCGYAASQLADGLSPEQARAAALEAACALSEAAAALRRAARLSGPERRALARQLAAVGVPTKAIAETVGICDRTVRFYVHGRGG